MITTETFNIRFPEFSSISNDTIQMLLDEAYLFINGNKYQDYMVLYWTAHNLVVQQNQELGDTSTSSMVASDSVANVSTSYANPDVYNSDVSFYNSTSYGQKYLQYKNALCVGNVLLV